MKKLAFTVSVLTMIVLTGCEMQSRHANVPASHPCYNKAGDDYIACLEKREAMKGLDKASGITTEPPPSSTALPASPIEGPSFDEIMKPATPPTFEPTPPGVPGAFLDTSSTSQAYRVVPVCSSGGQGGDPGRNISVYNHLKGMFVEFRADSTQPCNLSGVASTPVQLLSTALRRAIVIPGDGTSKRRALYTSSAPQGTYTYDVDVWRPNAHGFAEHVAVCSQTFTIPALTDWQQIHIKKSSLKDQNFCVCDNPDQCMNL